MRWLDRVAVTGGADASLGEMKTCSPNSWLQAPERRGHSWIACMLAPAGRSSGSLVMLPQSLVPSDTTLVHIAGGSAPSFVRR